MVVEPDYDVDPMSEYPLWTEVFSFAHRGGVVGARGVITYVDSDLAQIRVRDVAHAVSLSVQDCNDVLAEVVRKGGDVVRLECRVDLVTHHAVSMHLMVQADEFDRRLQRGGFLAEEWTIHLACTVWREVRLPRGDTEETHEEHEERSTAASELWHTHLALYPHQRHTVAWMRRLEARCGQAFRYSGNLHIAHGWYLDTESECFTHDPSWREAHLAGGLCADGTGSGKTATVLRLVAETTQDEVRPQPHHHYASRATLVVLPLNLVAQWDTEIRKFLNTERVRVVWMVQSRDARDCTMRHLLDAHVVVTTFHFLRQCRAYQEMLESALGGRSRNRAALSAWSRQVNHREAVLEAVHWRRVVVDELHETFTNPRDLRQLRLFTTHCIWGLTATPELDTDEAQHLYLLLRREKPHHPQLLQSLTRLAVRSHHAGAMGPTRPTTQLQLVRLTAEERVRTSCTPSVRATGGLSTGLDKEDDDDVKDLLRLGEGADEEQDRRMSHEELARVVRECTFVEHLSEESSDLSVGEQYKAARQAERQTLCAALEAHERSVRVLEVACGDLGSELCRSATTAVRGSDERARVLARAMDARERDLREARGLCHEARERLRRFDSHEALVHRASACVVCGLTDDAPSLSHAKRAPKRMRTDHKKDRQVGEAEVGPVDTKAWHLASCGHVLCTACAPPPERVCPVCESPFVQTHAVESVSGVGSKLDRIGRLLQSVETSSPVILFVQWKSMMRGIKAFLKSLELRVLLLDGNLAQRTATLHEFERGGVLLLCLEDCFAGLHLPHAHHVVFAHALVGDRRTVEQLERQAIARCVRVGQTRTVQVHSFVVSDTAEEALWHETHD